MKTLHADSRGWYHVAFLLAGFILTATPVSGADSAIQKRFTTEAPVAWDRLETSYGSMSFHGTMSDWLEIQGKEKEESSYNGLAVWSKRKPGFFLFETHRAMVAQPGPPSRTAYGMNPVYGFFVARIQSSDAKWELCNLTQGQANTQDMKVSLQLQFGAFLNPDRFFPTVSNREFFAKPLVNLTEVAADPGLPELVRVTFTYSHDEDPQKTSQTGTCLFDSSRNWELVESESRVGTAFVHRQVEHRDDPKTGGRPFAKIRLSTGSTSGTRVQTFTIDEFDFNVPSEDVFKLSVYGLPEVAPLPTVIPEVVSLPTGQSVKPTSTSGTPQWLYLALTLATVFVLLGLGIRFRRSFR